MVHTFVYSLVPSSSIIMCISFSFATNALIQFLHPSHLSVNNSQSSCVSLIKLSFSASLSKNPPHPPDAA